MDADLVGLVFFTQQPAYEVRISDWSSDVCSSDLKAARIAELEAALAARDTLIDTLRHQLAQLRRMTFGQSSEKLALQIEQLELALEELEGEAEVADSRTADRAPAERVSPVRALPDHLPRAERSEEHTSELQSLMRISYAVFCLKKKHK